jgi:hypothetical protein
MKVRLPTSVVRAVAAIPMLLAAAGVAAGDGPPDQCTDLSSVAPRTDVRYELIQSIFNTSCTGCHPGSVGAGNLGLGANASYGNLIDVPSDGFPSLLRVAPGDPLGSMLFLKLNCDDPPGLGVRMPLNASPLSPTQQAYFFDWIRVGAPLSRLGFENP